MLRVPSLLQKKNYRLAVLLAIVLLILATTVGRVISSPPPFDHGIVLAKGPLELLALEEEVPVYAALQSYYRSDGSGAQTIAFGWSALAGSDRVARELAAGYLAKETYESDKVPVVPVPGAVWMLGSGFVALVLLNGKRSS